MSKETITIPGRINELAKEHGGIRAAGRAIKLSAGYLSRLRNGKAEAPGDEALRKLGLIRHTTITYTRRKRYERQR